MANENKAKHDNPEVKAPETNITPAPESIGVKVAEVQAREVTLKATISTALEAAKALTPGTPEFDDAYGRHLAAKTALAAIPGELLEARKADNTAKINAALITIGLVVRGAVQKLNLADLICEPVTSVVWSQGATGLDGVVPEPLVTVNPKILGRATGPKAAKTAKPEGEGEVAKRLKVKYPDGSIVSRTAFVTQFATSEKEDVTAFKTPHTFIIDAAHPNDSTKFDEFCAAHNLTGYSLV